MTLSGFYRAKVVDNVDEQRDGRVLVHVINLNKTLWIRPSNNYGSSKDDKINYKLESGSFETAREGQYVAVFFLEDDINQGFFIPGMTLPYAGQTPNGLNLPKDVKLNYLTLKKRLNIKFREFFNGNIVGVDLNDDTNSLFYVFDNGARIEFNSPNEAAKDGTRTSSLLKATKFIVDTFRHDSYFGSTIEASSSKKDASVEISAISKGATRGSADPISYVSGEKLPFLTTVKNIFSISKTGGSFITKVLGKGIDAESASSYSSSKSVDNGGVTLGESSISTDEVSDKKASIESTTSIDTEEGIADNKEKVLNSEVFSHKLSEDETLTGSKHDKTESKEFSFGEEVPLVSTGDNEVSNKDGHQVTSTVVVDDVVNSTKFIKKTIEKVTASSVERNSILTSTNDDILAESIESEVVSDGKIIKKSTLSSNSLSQSSVKQQLDLESGNSNFEIVNKFSIPNPADVTGVLGLDPKFQRGHKVSMSADEDKSTIEISSIKKAFPSDALGKPKFGVANSIKLTEEGKEAKVEISLMGGTPGGGLSVIFTTDGSGKITMELPKGDIDILAPDGTVTAECKTLDVKVNDSANIDVTNKAVVKATKVEVEATDVSVASTNVTIEGKATKVTGGVHTMNGTPAPNPAGGPYNCINLCPFSGLPHQGSIVSGT